MSDQPSDPRKLVREWTARLWLVLLGVAMVAWLAALVWGAICLIGSFLF
jgi:hypothetical protein